MKAEILCFWTVIIGALNWGPKNVYFAMKFRAQKWKFSKRSQLHRLYRPRGPNYDSGINDQSQIGLNIMLDTCLNLYWGWFREMGKKTVVFELLMTVSGPLGAPIRAPIKWKCYGWKIHIFFWTFDHLSVFGYHAKPRFPAPGCENSLDSGLCSFKVHIVRIAWNRGCWISNKK